MTTTAEDVASRWRTFLKRKVLVTSSPLGFAYPGLAIRFAPLKEIVASLLYVDLVSLLEMGLSTQMSRRKCDDLEDLKERIDYLAGEGRILDSPALHRIRVRRNEIGHKVVQVTITELDAAVPVVQQQLEAWGLVGPALAYEFFVERSAVRAMTEQEKTERPTCDHAVDYRVGVKRDERPVLEYTWTEFIGRADA